MAKSYVYKETKHPEVFRLVDCEGNWKRYVRIKKYTEAYLKNMDAALDREENIPPPTAADIAEADYFDGVTTILDGGYTKGAFFANWLSQHSPEERDKILSAAGEKGDMVHRTIDIMLTGGTEVKGMSDCCGTQVFVKDQNQMCRNCHLTCGTKSIWEPFVLERETQIHSKETGQEERLEDNAWDCLLSFESFWSAHNPILLTSEMTLYNTMFKYAGTADAIIILQKACGVKTCKCESLIGKIGFWDWKTSTGIRASYSAQVAAYACAENIGEYLPPGQAVDYTAILRLGTNHKATKGYEFHSFTQDDLFDGWQRFLGAKRIFDFENTPFDPFRDIIDIPDSIQITAPHFDMNAARAEFEKAALEGPKVSEVKKLDLDLNRLKVGTWIRHNLGGVAEVTELEDNGMVHLFRWEWFLHR